MGLSIGRSSHDGRKKIINKYKCINYIYLHSFSTYYFLSDIVNLGVTQSLCSSVCRGLIKNGEWQDEESAGGRRRTEALRQLCKMNPTQALNVRAMVVRDNITLVHSFCQNPLHGYVPTVTPSRAISTGAWHCISMVILGLLLLNQSPAV